MKKVVRFSLAILIIGIFIVGIVLLILGFKLHINNEVIYNYEINQNLDYDVDIHKNNIYETEKLGMNQTYVSSLVKNINFNFGYNYLSSSDIPFSYRYFLKATIKGEYNLAPDDQKSQVWSKEYSLLEKDFQKTSNGELDINEPIVIDYEKYNNEVISFRNEIGLPITAYLNLDFVVEIVNPIKNNEIRDRKVMNITFPLNQQAFKIKTSYDKNINKDIYKYDKDALKINYLEIIMGLLFVLGSLVLSIKLYHYILNITKKNNYEVNLKKILKTYGDIIIEVKSEIDKKGLEIVEVKDFNEMIDLASELNYPIIFVEKKAKELGEFTVAHNNVLYKHVLKKQ